MLLAQNALIVAAAAVLGIAIAWSALGVLSSLPALTSLRPDGMEYRIDARVLGFATLLSVVAAALVSIIPARLVVGRDVHHLLRVSAASGSGDRARRAQRLFVVGQVACATVLLTGAGLMARTVLHFAQVTSASRPNRLVTGSPSFPHSWRVPEKYLPVTEQILVGDRRSLPGVASVAVRANVPLAAPRRAGEPNARGKCGTAAGRARSERRAVDHARVLHHGRRSDREWTRVHREQDRKESVPVAIVNAWAARALVAGPRRHRTHRSRRYGRRHPRDHRRRRRREQQGCAAEPSAR